MIKPYVKTVALITESECIGCSKCIKACPVDAILGSIGKMHTVIANECIGCKLCLPPCPVDCITLISATLPAPTQEEKTQYAYKVRKRYRARQKRLAQTPNRKNHPAPHSHAEKQNYINQLIKRLHLQPTSK